MKRRHTVQLAASILAGAAFILSLGASLSLFFANPRLTSQSHRIYAFEPTDLADGDSDIVATGRTPVGGGETHVAIVLLDENGQKIEADFHFSVEEPTDGAWQGPF